MKKVSIIGHFADGLVYLDGQTIKTKIIANELCKRFGNENVIRFDTHGGIKTLVKAPWIIWHTLHRTNNVVILPAHNGLRVFGRLLPLLVRFFKDRKIHYVVIGGWLPKILEEKLALAKSLKKFDGIYVETNTMKRKLEGQGFNNVFIMPNCKVLTTLSEDELVYHRTAPYKLCTFSRVMKEKGIETAVEVVHKVNERLGYQAYLLDIYGQVDVEQKDWFKALEKRFTKGVRYCGCVQADRSVELLKDYFALLFPTHYYTEGIPGTIIDAYAAGIPVISAKWQSYGDVIDENVTGIGYEFDNADDLIEKLLQIEKSVEEFNSMKENCLKKSNDFTPNNAIEVMLKNLV